VQQVLVRLAGAQLELQVGFQVVERDRHYDDLAAPKSSSGSENSTRPDSPSPQSRAN
jgi:hypothetical protein